MKNTPLLIGDYIIIISVIILAIVIFVVTLPNVKPNIKVEISHDGKLIHSIDITDETIIQVDDVYHNTIVIADNTVRVISSSCPDGICENFGVIRSQGESIICMPNKLIITIVGEDLLEYDVIT